MSLLRAALRQLARAPEAELARDGLTLAAGFSAALARARARRDHGLSELQELGLLGLDALLDDLDDAGDPDLAAPGAVYDHPAWRAVRTEARRVHGLFDPS